MSDRLHEALELIDHANAADPTSVTFNDAEYPTSLIEGQRAHHWAQHLVPGAADALLIATRGHHLRRWEVPRNSYPRTRQGYFTWRVRLYDFHAEAVADVMQQTGYAEGDVAHAARLLRKQAIKEEADAQAYEDAVSLAFLEVRLAWFMDTVTDEQLTRALRRTWRKMSDVGHAVALTLSLEPKAAAAVNKALPQ